MVETLVLLAAAIAIMLVLGVSAGRLGAWALWRAVRPRDNGVADGESTGVGASARGKTHTPFTGDKSARTLFKYHRDGKAATGPAVGAVLPTSTHQAGARALLHPPSG